MLERFRPHKPEHAEKPHQSLADTLVIFGRTELDNHKLELDGPSHLVRFVACHAINAGAAKKIVIGADSPDSLRILESYFEDVVPKKSLVKKFIAGMGDEATALREAASDSDFGRTALISAGKSGEKTLKDLKEKGIADETLSLEEEIGRRITESATSSGRSIIDTLGIFANVLRNRNAADVKFTRLTLGHGG